MKRGAETREALLDAALEVMSARGFHGTSIPDLAERAGVGAATMYRHFESKEALVNALYVHAKRQFAALLFDGFPADAPVRKAISEIWARLVEVVRDHTTLVVFLEMHHHGTYLTPETLAACEDLFTKPFERLLRRGQAEGVVRGDDPALITAFLTGAFLGVAKAAIGPGGRVDVSLLRKAEPLVWAAIRA
jgi:AcrR family transcriptional regulator